jgi:hypothetical protein
MNSFTPVMYATGSPAARRFSFCLNGSRSSAVSGLS